MLHTVISYGSFSFFFTVGCCIYIYFFHHPTYEQHLDISLDTRYLRLVPILTWCGYVPHRLYSEFVLCACFVCHGTRFCERCGRLGSDKIHMNICIYIYFLVCVSGCRDPQVVLFPRNKTDANAENHAKLLAAVKKGNTKNDGPPIMGSLLKESFEG